MADYQRVVEFLRDIRSAPITEMTDEIRQYAIEYADMCKQANERLRRCTAFLQQGLRSEALQLAAEPPNLLDFVAALDLPDAVAWADVCAQFELPLPPPLQLDRAAMLNEAYAADASLEELLNRHRLLALARAPLKDRLKLMRQVASMDTASTFWDKDIRAFEHARIKEMRLECQNAVRGGDAPAISDLAAEIEQEQWLEPIPQDLQGAVNTAFGAMMKAEVEAKLQSVLDQLRSAYAAKQHEQCGTLVQQCREMLDAAGLKSVSVGIAQELGPIVQWVQRENEIKAKRAAFVSACGAFVQLIEASADENQLADAYRRLRDMGEQIPGDITDRYQRLLQTRQAAMRKRRTIYLSLGAAGVVVILLLVWIVVQYSASEQWAGKIRSANAAEDIGQARQLIGEQEKRAPRLGSFPGLASAKRETAALQQRLVTYHDELKKLVEANLPARAEAEAAVRQEDASADTLLSAAGNVNVALARLEPGRKLAWADADKSYANLVRDLADLRAQLREKAAARVRRQAEAISSEVEAVPLDGDLDANLAKLDAIVSRMAPLRAMDGLDVEIKTMLAGTATRIEQRKQHIQQAKVLTEQVQALKRPFASPDALKERLGSFATQFPADPRSKDLAAAAQQIPAAKAVEAWDAMVRSWTAFSPGSASIAAERAAALDAFAKANPNSPFTADAATYLAYLRQAADVLGDKGVWRPALGDMLASPLVCELSVVRLTDGRRYYTLGDIKRRDETKPGKSPTSTFEALDPKNPQNRQPITVTFPVKIATTQPVRLPHTDMAARLADDLRQIDENNFDTWTFDAIDRIAAREDVEPAVQGLILLAMVKTQQQVIAWALPGAYEKAEAALVRLDLDKMIWWDAEKPVADSTNVTIRAAIRKIPSGSELKPKLAARKAELWKACGFRVAGYAMLLKNEQGAWSVYGATNSADDTTAYALVTNAPANKLIAIARAKAGQYIVDANAVGALPEGTLLILR